MANNKDIQQVVDTSIQHIPEPEHGGTQLDILQMLAVAGEILPLWWSQRRDIGLSQFWKGNDNLSAALSMFSTKTASVPVQIVPVDASIKAWVREADIANMVLNEGSDFGGTWAASLCPRLTESWNTQDNGSFTEVIGAGEADGPIEGMPVGLALLDSQYCTRTGNPEFPVIYDDRDGKRYKLHHTRVMFFSSQPSKSRNMNKVGFCALSRMVQTGQHLTDINVYEQEKLGSRPHRQMIIGESGITGQEILTAFTMANESLDNSNLSRYSKNVIIGPKTPKQTSNAISISVQDLASAPDGFDKETSITLGMFTIALALNIPPRWIWPASQSGATKADAMFQHTAGLGGGIGFLLQVYKTFLERAFNGPFGLRKFKVEFDYQDDEQDKASSEISRVRSETREKDLLSGSIDIRTAHQQMLDKAEITEPQFNRMELEAGRLPTGDSVLNLFLSSDDTMQDLLSLSVGNPLNIDENIDNIEFVLEQIKQKQFEAIAIAQNSSRLNQRNQAKQAIKALDELAKIYQEVDSDDDILLIDDSNEDEEIIINVEGDKEDDMSKSLTIVKGKDILGRINRLEKELKQERQKNNQLQPVQEKQTTVIVSPSELPAITLNPQIIIEPSIIPAPIVNIPEQQLSVSLEIPETEEIITVNRNDSGFIQTLIKRIRRK